MIPYIRESITDCRFARQLFPYVGLLTYDLERGYQFSSCDGDTGQQD
jgi:hypothetical protein